MPMDPVVQVSLDVETITEALELAAIAVRAGVDWLEVGTPLILGEGVHAVRALKERYPGTPLVVDLKIIDAGYLETEMMAKAGADMVVVMGVAHPSTVRAAVKAARDYHIKVMGDVLAARDKVECARRLEEIGVDYVVVHTGYDERQEITGASPLQSIDEIIKAVRVPVQAVGGLTIEQAISMPSRGAPLVVIGAPLAIDPSSFHAAAEDVEQILREIVHRIKGLPSES
jgi:3-hexulose-6-phosphate synthase